MINWLLGLVGLPPRPLYTVELIFLHGDGKTSSALTTVTTHSLSEAQGVAALLGHDYGDDPCTVVYVRKVA